MHDLTLLLAAGLAMAPTLVAAIPATTTTSSSSTTATGSSTASATTTTSSSCTCVTASANPSTTATVCGVNSTVGADDVVPVNTGGTGPNTYVDSVSQCANLCYGEYETVCQSFSVSPLPDGFLCDIFAYNISSLDLSANPAGGAFYDRACYEQTCPSTCPPSVTTTISGEPTCTCAAIATVDEYPQVSITCGQTGTAAASASATPIATSVSPYGPSDGYAAEDNYGASLRYCGKACLTDDDCESFVMNPSYLSADTNVTYSCVFYPESVNATGFAEVNANEEWYDKNCLEFECASGTCGC